MYPFFGSTCVLVRDILNTYALLNLSKNSSAFIITKNQKLATYYQEFFKSTYIQYVFSWLTYTVFRLDFTYLLCLGGQLETSFWKYNIGWPQQASEWKDAKIQHEFSWFCHVITKMWFTHLNLLIPSNFDKELTSTGLFWRSFLHLKKSLTIWQRFFLYVIHK